MSRLICLLLALVCVGVGAPSGSARAENEVPPAGFTTAADAYPLDTANRTVAKKGKLVCPSVGIIVYRGTHLAYDKPLRIHEALVPVLARFETIVAEEAIKVYGRAPAKVRHLGSLNCRRVRTIPGLLSEHGMGNALDVAGFAFAAAPRAQRAALPAGLRGKIVVDMLAHFRSKRPKDEPHRRFLHALSKRLIDEDLFRVLLGPGYPGHENHLHVDMAPYRLVDIDL